jgi:molecular chaperone GrpE
MMDDKDKSGDEIEFIAETPPPGEGEREAAAPDAPQAPKKEPEEKTAGEGSRHLKERIKHLKQELVDLKEAHLRRLADMENLRKRFEREKAEFQQYAVSDLMLELLTISDNFERALKSAPAEAEAKITREGVELIFRMFQSLLAKNGVRPIVLEDRSFDPNFHHAMIVEESEEVEEPTVQEELQKGYMIRDRLLRPALVKVLVPKKGQ